MRLIETISELRENLAVFEAYRYSSEGIDKSSQSDLVEKGIIFVAHKSGGRYVFVPSRFLGYKRNTLDKHHENDGDDGKNGRKTTTAIDEILGFKSKPDAKLEKYYQRYCLEIGASPKEKGSFGVERKYWKL